MSIFYLDYNAILLFTLGVIKIGISTSLINGANIIKSIIHQIPERMENINGNIKIKKTKYCKNFGINEMVCS